MKVDTNKFCHFSLAATPFIITILLTFALLSDSRQIAIALLFAGIIAALIFYSLPVKYLLPLYFVYLLFDGFFKMLAKYHPVAHVTSDILLIAICARIVFIRFQTSSLNSRPEGDIHIINLVCSGLIIFWISVLVQFFNPWGIGFLPSLAALKTYAVPVLPLLMIAYFLTEDETKTLMPVLFACALIQCIVTTIDWFSGGLLWATFSPYYVQRYESVFSLGPMISSTYRPYGTTSVPGSPASWVTFGTMALLLIDWAWFKKRLSRLSIITTSIAVFVFGILGVTTVLACGVRSILVRVAGLLVVTFLFKDFRKGVITILLLIASWVGLLSSIELLKSNMVMDPLIQEGILTKLERFATLGKATTFTEARQGALTRMNRLADHTIMGIGLSRVSGHSTPWASQAKQERVFRTNFSFADNVYNFLFNELGLLGLISYLILIAIVTYCMVTKMPQMGPAPIVYVLLTVISGFGSEVPFAQPDASIFWLIVGIGLCHNNHGTTTSIRNELANKSTSQLRFQPPQAISSIYRGGGLG